MIQVKSLSEEVVELKAHKPDRSKSKRNEMQVSTTVVSGTPGWPRPTSKILRDVITCMHG